MEIAYFSKFTEGAQRIDCLTGDSQAFAFGEGSAIPLEEAYCRRVVERTAPSLVPDTAEEPRMLDLGAAEALGSYAGVPVTLSDGRVYGSLCCASRGANRDLDEKDEAYLELLAQSLGALFEGQPDVAPAPSHRDGSVGLSLWFAGVSRAPRCARSAIGVLEPCLDEELLEGLRLLITELITNSLRHSGTDARETVGLDINLSRTLLRCEVSDSGPGFERPQVIQPHADRPGGFGLVILDSIADRWNVFRDERFRVWFEVDVDGQLD